ncbi:MAG: hypothetical protein ACD_73C00262G0007 [uncultured bacterium]|nr:MAG: hypothetical protein ACD_73C00262G0007 [uncultured bacterium]
MASYMNHKSFSYFIIFVLLFTMATPVWAAERIVNVDFIGLSQNSEAGVRRKISSVEGSLYSDQLINEDIKKLYETGLFQNVTVERLSIAGGIKLIFKVDEKGTISKISFKGNSKIKEKDLNAAVTIRELSTLDERRLAESLAAIRKLYEDKGYYLADVTHEVVPLDTESKEGELIFRIQENKEVRIKRISFVGNRVYSDKKLTSQMLTKVKGFLSFLNSSGKFKDEKLKRDLAFLEYFYLNNGYLKAKIGDPQLTLTRDKKSIYITIPVYEGSSYKVSSVDIAGDIITTKEELVSKLSLKAGETYSRKDQDQDMTELTNMYGDQAYAHALIYPDIQTSDENKTASVTYTINKGPKIYVERIEIKGNTITRDKVIRREIQLKENSLFSRSGLDESKRRIMQLGYFEDVNFSEPRGSRDDRIVLTVDVKEKPTGSFSLGAGFSSLESFVLTASVQKDNFFGYGIQGAVSANISKLRQDFSVSATDRYFLDTRWIVSASAYRYSSALNRDFDQESFGGSVTFGREIFPHFDVNLGYSIADVSVTNFSSQVPQFFQDNASGLTSSVLSTVAYDTRDNRLSSSKGMYHAVSSEYAGRGVGGDNDFWKVYVDSRVFFALPWKTVLKLRGMFGYVNSLNNQPVPLFERFYLGGPNSLRGFDLNTIGPSLKIPKTATGGDSDFTYGGNRLAQFNMEYEVPIYAPAGIKTVVFLDSGQAYGENEAIDISRFRSNYGVGLRWASPFGPLRFEWGFPIMKRSGESFSVFNFTIGQSF